MMPRKERPLLLLRAALGVVLVTMLVPRVQAQLVIWAEEFENGCGSGCYASAYTLGANGIWTVTNVGAQGTCPNQWFISCRENGNATGTCGTDCTTTNETLHIGNELVGVCASPNGCIFCPGGDCGAAYDAGCPPAFCAFCLCGCLNTQTNKRAETPIINLSAYSNITLNIKYMENGQGASDDFLVEYWNGAVWAALSNPPKTPAGACGAQGQWTQYSVALPASANNNPTVRVGFRWQNNNDGSGADPSVAIDDVQLTVPYTPTCVGPFVNEVSNGPATEKEYIELMVCGPPCTTVDLRNWKIDDNNGAAWNGFGSVMVNSGVSTGHLRFANIAQWAAVPTGSIILIYNNTDLNALLPPDDPNDSAPVDSVYVLPVNHAAIQSCGTLPSAITSSAYNPCGFAAGAWPRVVLRNDGDAAQVRYPNGQYFHGVSYGPNTQNMNTGGADLLRISTVNHAGRVIYFNAVDPRVAANFTSAAVAGNETPGAANNVANLLYRRALQCVTPLPVELLSFTARNDGPAVLLEWSTATEKDNAHFTVERSTDGLTFQDLLNLPGAGDSQATLHYHAHDVDPMAGTTYYRLRQTDHNGTASHSNTVAVYRSTATNGLAAAVVGDRLVRIEHPCPQATWELLDPLGRVLGRGASTGDTGSQWLAPPQASGTAFLRLWCAAEVATFKLVF